MKRLIFQNENFQFMEYSGVGVNDTEYQALRVDRIGNAEKYMVDVELNFKFPNFNGDFVKYKYYDATVTYGSSNRIPKLEEVEEFIEVLQDGIAFARYINKWLDENPEYKA